MTDLEPEALEHEIALILDHPSVYMGGPSARSRSMAERIVAHVLKALSHRRAALPAETRECVERSGGWQVPAPFDMLADDQIEAVCDAGLRHRSGSRPEDYLKAWLKLARLFGYATQDDSWGELEKELCIVFRNHIRLMRQSNDAARLLTEQAALLAQPPQQEI